MAEPNPHLPRVKGRMPFAAQPRTPGGGGGVKRFSAAAYAVLTIALIGVAVYMGRVVGHPLMSPYVISPAVGALWFGLRLFMTLAPKT